MYQDLFNKDNSCIKCKNCNINYLYDVFGNPYKIKSLVCGKGKETIMDYKYENFYDFVCPDYSYNIVCTVDNDLYKIKKLNNEDIEDKFLKFFEIFCVYCGILVLVYLTYCLINLIFLGGT